MDEIKAVKEKVKFIRKYMGEKNPADSSEVDSNANVSSKNIVTMQSEIGKKDIVFTNRALLHEKIEEMYGKSLADEYLRQLNEHIIYKHDESFLGAYCLSVSMYPFLLNGLTSMGGESKAPKHLDSFCGGVINLAYMIASQVAGAVALPEIFLYMDYFAKKDLGRDYIEYDDNKRKIKKYFEQMIYSLNQPAGTRNFQCVRSDTTQISTPNGYKYLHELNIGDICYVIKNGKIECQPIEKINVYDYDGELLQFRGRNYQQTVTPNHRVVYKKANTNEYDIKEAHKLFGHSKLSLPISAELKRKDYDISDEMLRLCVVVLTDGSISYKDKENISSGKITIYKSKKRWGYKEIPALLRKLNISFTESKAVANDFGDMVIFNISTNDSKYILKLINYTKKKVPCFFNKLSKRQAKIVIDTWKMLDGIYKNNLLQCDSEEIRDSLQEIAFLAGYGSGKYNRTMKKYNSEEECIIKYIKLFKRGDKRASEYNKITYKGKVWCPTTEAGVVIFREENGVPYISGNSVFWNVSMFDSGFFNSMFGNFVFPDGTKPEYPTLFKLQKLFMEWFQKERERSLLTFPVITMAMVTKNSENEDKEFEDFVSECAMNGDDFFIYQGEATSLSSCCRLRNDIDDNTFSHSLGAGGVATGSLSVMTLNLPRFINKCKKDNKNLEFELMSQLNKMYKWQNSYKSIIKEYIENKMIPVYDAGYIQMDKQFLTIGIVGVPEAYELSENKNSGNNEEYKKWVENIFSTITEENKKARTKFGHRFNTELVPAENVAVKFAKWDKEDGINDKFDIYSSYYYKPNDDSLNISDKFILHAELGRFCDGGQALHLNLSEQYKSKEQFKEHLKISAKLGLFYWTWNVPRTYCQKCGKIVKKTVRSCPKCNSRSLKYATRIIGYLKFVENFSEKRREEESKRIYHKRYI